jgi:hypothetical protein
MGLALILVMLATVQVTAPEPPPAVDPEVSELNRAAKAPSDAAIARFDQEQAQYREMNAAFEAAQARYRADTAAYEAAMRNYRDDVAASEEAGRRWGAEIARPARPSSSRRPAPPPAASPKRQICARETVTGSTMPRLVCRERN